MIIAYTRHIVEFICFSMEIAALDLATMTIGSVHVWYQFMCRISYYIFLFNACEFWFTPFLLMKFVHSLVAISDKKSLW